MNNKIMSKIVASTLLVSMVGYTIPVFAYTKDETVYSKLDASGNNYKTIVSEHLKNSEDAELINDLSNLLNVTNTNGEETFTQDGNKFTWNAKGNDIYYQGDTEKELPIDCNIKYELDGKEISKDELAGKSGKLKIDLQYTNKEKRVVTVNGRNVNVYVPFVVVAGTMIKNEKAQNIEVSTGKVVDDGSKTLVVGLAMPGLQESLGISKNDIDIPSNVEITMDVTDFEMQSIVTYVTPKVFGNDDLKAFDELDKIYADVNKLQSASNQILTGATALNDGASKVNDGAKQVNSGANELANGQKQVTTGLKTIQSSLPSESSNKENEKQLNLLKTTNSSTVNKLNAANKQIEAQKTEIDTKIAEATNKKAYVNTQLNGDGTKENPGVKAQATAAEKAYNEYKTKLDQVNAGLKQLSALPDDATMKQPEQLTDDQVKAKTEHTLSELIALKQKKAELEANKSTLETVIPLLKNQSDALNGTVDALNGTLEAINGTIDLLNQTKTSLTTSETANTGLSTLITNNNKVVNSSMNTINSMRKLNSGVNQLVNGSESLQTGAEKLASGASDLQNGTNSLAEGSAELKDGIQQFNEDGIKKLCNLINGDVKSVADRAEKLNELSKEYNSFTMLDKNAEGEVKFIMITDQIKKQTDAEQDKEQAVLNNDENSSDENQ